MDDNLGGKVGWSRYQASDFFPGVDKPQTVRAARYGLNEAGFVVKKENSVEGYVMGEHGLTPYDWNIVCGVYVAEKSNGCKVKVIAQGSRDIGFSGDATGSDWPQDVLRGMKYYLGSNVSASRAEKDVPAKPIRPLPKPSVTSKNRLMVRDIDVSRGVDKNTAKALSNIMKSALGEYYEVQSLDDLAALSVIVEEKLKAGCDDTKCLIEVAGAMDIGLVVTGDISKFGNLYTLNMQLISTQGSSLGVIARASEDCRCSEEELVVLAKRVALGLIGK